MTQPGMYPHPIKPHNPHKKGLIACLFSYLIVVSILDREFKII